METRCLFAFILGIALAPTVLALDTPSANECETGLVQMDEKGVFATLAQCGLTESDVKAIEQGLWQIRHDLKPSFQQMQGLVAATNVILGAVLGRLNAGDISMDGVLSVIEALAGKGLADASLDWLDEASRWKSHYQTLMAVLQAHVDAGYASDGAVGALRQLELSRAARLMDEMLEAQSEQDPATPGLCYLRAQAYLLQWQPEHALPLLEKASRLQPDNREYRFAYAQALQGQDASSSAEAHYQALLEQYRKLAKDNPAQYTAAVAATLNNLGLLYAESQRTGEAEKNFKAAIDAYREQSKPDAAGLALALNNLANVYRDHDRPGEAATAYREALELRRSLARDDPAVYQRSVAATLTNLGSAYMAAKQPQEAEKAYREALDDTRQLARVNPAVKPDMDAILTNLGNLYSEVRKPAEAEAAFNEARDLQREMAQQNPKIYEPKLAATLNSLGNVYSDARKMDEAEKAYREALSLRASLAKENPGTYRPQVAITLNNMGAMHKDNKNYAEAEKAYREALDIQRELYAADPQQHAANLKTMLTGAAGLMDKADKPAEKAKLEVERAAVR